MSPKRSVLRTALKFLPWELAHGVIWRLSLPSAMPEAMLNAMLAFVYLIVGANLISALVDRQRRTLYDRMSKTRVIRR